MLDEKGFDLWADAYDAAVSESDEENSYPFAGYRKILNAIYSRILSSKAVSVLDVGFGTGTLASALYEKGCRIYGQDFSEKMCEIAQQKMPNARLYRKDFSEGIADELKNGKYDAVIATYSLHHLSDEQKLVLIKELRELLNGHGVLYIGDIAFENREAMDACRKEEGENWDDEEIYFAADEILSAIPGMVFELFSRCSGLFTLKKQ